MVLVLGGATAIAQMAADEPVPADGMDAATITLDGAGVDSTAIDSLAVEPVDMQVVLNEAADSAYRHLKYIQYEGITEGELYPNVITTYQATVDALNGDHPSDADITRFRGVFADIAPSLMRGAVYYSRNQDNAEMARFATAYADLRLCPIMEGMSYGKADDSVYPSLLYVAASGAYNSGEFEKAVDYLEAYLRTGAKERRESVYAFYGQAAIKTRQAARCTNDLLLAVEEFPANYNIMLMALQCCLDCGETDRLQPVLDKALLLHPNDEQLLNVQGRLLENEGQYADALGFFERLYELKPNSLSVNQHVALCYYNLGANYYNNAIMTSDEKQNKKYLRQANAYFSSAAERLSRIVENDPTNAKYLMALGKTYGCLGRKENLDEINTRLAALGLATIRINDMPEAITVDGVSGNSAQTSATEIPDFQTFSAQFVANRLKTWSQIQEFEKMEDFRKRVNQESIVAQHKALSREAEKMYIDKYARHFRIADMKLMPYDAENECYKIESTMGDFVIKVPLKNREAEIFKSQWETTRVRDPKYYIKDNHVAIASITLVTTSGKSYSYNSENALNYDYTPVSVDLAAFLNQNQSSGSAGLSAAREHQGTVIRAQSDVDINIPETSRRAEKTLALVIANENYSKVSRVESAQQDGETFAQYCRKTLGIPEKQVMYYSDVTLGDMIDAVGRTKNLVGALGGNVDLIVYYAGHGFPDEGSKDAYLLPSDGNGQSVASAYSLKKFYSDLASTGAANVMVFLDACFSGASRDGDMLVHARGVALKPRAAAPEGNMFILSAASDSETAMPYREKHHGLFTYYLLKKIQETKGNVTLRELSEYVTDNVKRNSISINGKAQSPRANVSGTLTTEWTKKKLRP